MTVFIHYDGRTYELAADVDRHEAFSVITERLNHAWARRDSAEDRPSIDRGMGYVPDDYEPWIHLKLAGGGAVSLHIHDGMHLAFEDTEAED